MAQDWSKGVHVEDKRDDWVKGVREMLDKLSEIPELPLPKLASDYTFVAMVTRAYEPGELLVILRHITEKLPGATQEFYNFTSDKLPEMDRIRLVWMFGKVRYELDASESDVFGPSGERTIFPGVNYIGENVNTVILPDSSEK